MKKKITLFKHFKKYFNKNKADRASDPNQEYDKNFLKTKVELDTEGGDDAKPNQVSS